MNANLMLAGIVSNESIYFGLFILFVVIPVVLIASVIVTIKTRTRIIPCAAAVGAACGPILVFFLGGYGEMTDVVENMGNAIFAAVFGVIPGTGVGLVAWLIVMTSPSLRKKFDSDGRHPVKRRSASDRRM